jgi:glycosyltransferase involved in cell wall biosynthesis
MAAGLPIVTTDVDGVREVITDGREGIVVPSRNARALADAIVGLMANSARRSRLGVNGAQGVKERFSLDAMIEQTVDVYSRAMNA